MAQVCSAGLSIAFARWWKDSGKGMEWDHSREDYVLPRFRVPVNATELLAQVKKPLPTPKPIDSYGCPPTTRGPGNGLVLVPTDKLVYQGVHYVVASVILNLTEVRLPAFCPRETELLYQALLKEMFRSFYELDFGDVNVADLYRQEDTTEWGRQRRRVINYIFTGFNTEASVMNSLDDVQLALQINGLKSQLRSILGKENNVLGSTLHEGVAMTVHLKEIIAQLEAHARTINTLIKEDRLASDQAAQNEMVGEIYAVVEAHISEGFQALLRENEEQKQQLEKKIRPDFNQILASKKQVLEKIQASLGKRVRRFCEEQVRPHLGSARDGVVNSMNAGLEETRRLFSEEVSRVINMVKNAGQGISLTEVCSQLRALPTQSVQVHRCYEKTDELERFLSKVGPRFAFSGDRFLIQRAQNIIQQLLEDAAYTFQHLLVCTKPATGLSTETCQILDNTRVRVLKKFDSDSSAAGRQFVRDTLLELFLPYVLKSLDPTCKPELPVYEASLCTDDYGVIQIDSTYRELVLHVVSEEINRAMKKPSTQPGYSLYSESMSCLWDNEPRLSIAEAPRTSPAKTTRSTSPAESTPQSSAVGPLTEHKGQAENAAASENSEMSEADEGRRWLGVREGKAGATQGEGQNGLAEWNVSHLDNDDRKESGSHEPKSPSTVREMLEALK
uniref:protein Niban 1-like n=1 Tax=Pristiophorus japonicus TaxID=55135 RepID=UPI00398E9151